MNKHDKSYALSDSDIRNIFNNKIKIIKYSEIKHYNDIEDLLYPYDKTVILWEKEPSRGHWTILFRNKKKIIYFFDSYGYACEEELKYIDSTAKHQLMQGNGDLIRLFHNCRILYNKYQLQSKIPGIRTCGRWVICRVIFDDLNSKQFANMFLNKGSKPDDIITSVTNFLL